MDWITGAFTILGMELIARKMWQGWLVSLANQALWLYLIINRRMWGLLPLFFVLVWRYSAATIQWRREAARANIGSTFVCGCIAVGTLRCPIHDAPRRLL